MDCFAIVITPANVTIRIAWEYGRKEWALGCITAIWNGMRETANGYCVDITPPIFTRTKSDGEPNLGRLANAPTPARQRGTTNTEPPPGHLSKGC